MKTKLISVMAVALALGLASPSLWAQEEPTNTNINNMDMGGLMLGMNGLLYGKYHLHGEEENHLDDDIHDHGHGASLGEGLGIQEVMVGLMSDVDSFMRAVLHLHFHGGEWDFHDIYVQNLERMYWMNLKVGKIAPVVGSHNPLHMHMLPFANRSLHQKKLLGGERGISEIGFELNVLFPIPVVPLELSAATLQGSAEDLIDYDFGEGPEFDLRFTHLKTVLVLNPLTTLEVGTTYAGGNALVVASTGRSNTTVHLNVLDVTWKRLDPTGKDGALLLFNGEWAWRDINHHKGKSGGSVAGGHAFVQYKLLHPFFAQYRYAVSGLFDNREEVEQMHSLGMAFVPTKRIMARLQYDLSQHDGDLSGELIGQASFSVGAHEGHSYTK